MQTTPCIYTHIYTFTGISGIQNLLSVWAQFSNCPYFWHYTLLVRHFLSCCRPSTKQFIFSVVDTAVVSPVAYLYTNVNSPCKHSTPWKLVCSRELRRRSFCVRKRHFEADVFERSGSAPVRQRRGGEGGRVHSLWERSLLRTHASDIVSQKKHICLKY